MTVDLLKGHIVLVFHDLLPHNAKDRHVLKIKRAVALLHHRETSYAL